MVVAIPSCLKLFTQEVCLALHFALAKAGRSIAARIAMIAITTNNSINVKPRGRLPDFAPRKHFSTIIFVAQTRVSGDRISPALITNISKTPQLVISANCPIGSEPDKTSSVRREQGSSILRAARGIGIRGPVDTDRLRQGS